MEREVGGGIGMGKTCKLKDVSFQCMTKFTTKKKIKNKREKKKKKKKKKKPSTSVCVVTSGNFFYGKHSIVCIFFIHSCISGYLDFLHFLAIVNMLQ